MLFSPGGTARPARMFAARRYSLWIRLSVLIDGGIRRSASSWCMMWNRLRPTRYGPIQNLRVEAADVVRPIRHGVAGFAEIADVVPEDGIGVGDGHGVVPFECEVSVFASVRCATRF